MYACPQTAPDHKSVDLLCAQVPRPDHHDIRKGCVADPPFPAVQDPAAVHLRGVKGLECRV